MVTQDECSTIKYLQTLQAIRRECTKIYQLGLNGELDYFLIKPQNIPTVVQFIHTIINRDYPADSLEETCQLIPPHGRWRHFGTEGRLESLIDKFPKANQESIGNCLVDLFVISVLLDAGAGPKWSFTDEMGRKYARSEGLAIASYEMFKNGLFSSSKDNLDLLRVDADALANLTIDALAKGLQVGPANPINGLSGRLVLLQRLGAALNASQYFAGDKVKRPSNMIYYLQSQADSHHLVNIDSLWQVIVEGFGSIWPESRTKLNGISLGDVWKYTKLNPPLGVGLVPFHKLSQWLAYSLIEPIERFSKLRFEQIDKLTGLAEYRNGGLLIDMDVLELKRPLPSNDKELSSCLSDQLSNHSPNSSPEYPPDHPLIVEWRALTVCLLDEIANQLRAKLQSPKLSLAKVLEAGTWKAGREIAASRRPDGAPPVAIVSDGTLF